MTEKPGKTLNLDPETVSLALVTNERRYEASLAKEATLKEIQGLREAQTAAIRALDKLVAQRIKLQHQFLLQKVAYEKEIYIRELRLLNRQLETAAAELSRRLDTLNHAHEASLVDRATFVNIDVYNAKMEDYGKWREGVNAVLNNAAGRSVAYGIVAAFISGLLSILIGHFWK